MPEGLDKKISLIYDINTARAALLDTTKFTLEESTALMHVIDAAEKATDLAEAENLWDPF